MEQQRQSRRDQSGASHRIHFEKILSIIPLPYYWSWAIFAAVSFLISLYLLQTFQSSYNYAWAFLVLSTLTAMQSTGIIWAHRKMDLFSNNFVNLIELPRVDVKRKYEEKASDIFNDRKLFAFGMAAAILAGLLGVSVLGFSFLAVPEMFFKIIYYSAVYTLGAGLYVMIMTASAVHKIGHFQLNSDALFSRDMQDIGILYSKFTAYSAIIYIIWTFFWSSVPCRLPPQHRTLLFVSFAVILLAYFVVPQYGIHRLMVRTKGVKTDAFLQRLKMEAENAFKEPTDENMQALDDLLEIQHKLDKLSVWPFGFYEILHIALITVVPLMVLTLELMHGALI
jgi:hypothetical protein